ncbi:zinc finger BED domain-containing protein 4-like [Chaetodon trifascialis]|uniref:zinc finger BED domain-containing protein 4-like n=1 Tax=Chaetodon trifascialis TaxID=109706 RepID=UPI003992A8A9
MAKENPRAAKITEALAQYIALDDQPLSVVENSGFRKLLSVLEPRYAIPSRHYITDTELPKLHNAVKKHIQGLLQDIPAFSFTTDIWSSTVTPMSLISLTAHWIGEDFTRKNAILHAKQFRGSHTGTAIACVFEEKLETWGIPKSSVHVVVRDSAKNMIKAMNEAGLPSLSCVAHTFQLAVNEGLLSQRSVSDAVAIGRKIVGHFKHSPLAYSRLEDVQLELLQPTARLQQDVPTRWNSTYYMMQSLTKQKRALTLYGSEYELPATLSTHQWTLLEHAMSVLSPFEELTKRVSSSDALASDVIPAVTVLLRVLTQETEQDQGIKTMKATLTAAVRRRFSDVERNPLYSIASVLDPRYKDCFFSNTNTAVEAKEMVRLELQKLSGGEADVGEPPARKQRKAQASRSSLDSVFAEIVNEQVAASLRTAPVGGAIELETYLGEALSKQDDKPLQYWGLNKVRFPTLAKMSRKYLSAPCSSVDSERLFSSVTHIVDETRNRITPEHAEMLLFIKKNLPLTFP